MSWGNKVAQGGAGNPAEPWYVTFAGGVLAAIVTQGNPNADQTKAWWVALRSVTKGASTGAGITSTSISADTQALDVAIQASSTLAVAASGGAALALNSTLTNGTQITHGPAVTPVISRVLEASHVIKATSGTHYSTTVTIDKTAPSATYYIQMIQGGGGVVPADGAVTMLHAAQEVVFVTGSPFTVSFNDIGAPATFTTGLCVVISTAQFTKVISGSYITVDSSVV